MDTRHQVLYDDTPESSLIWLRTIVYVIIMVGCAFVVCGSLFLALGHSTRLFQIVGVSALVGGAIVMGSGLVACKGCRLYTATRYQIQSSSRNGHQSLLESGHQTPIEASCQSQSQDGCHSDLQLQVVTANIVETPSGDILACNVIWPRPFIILIVLIGCVLLVTGVLFIGLGFSTKLFLVVGASAAIVGGMMVSTGAVIYQCCHGRSTRGQHHSTLSARYPLASHGTTPGLPEERHRLDSRHVTSSSAPPPEYATCDGASSSSHRNGPSQHQVELSPYHNESRPHQDEPHPPHVEPRPPQDYTDAPPPYDSVVFHN